MLTPKKTQHSLACLLRSVSVLNQLSWVIKGWRCWPRSNFCWGWSEWSPSPSRCHKARKMPNQIWSWRTTFNGSSRILLIHFQPWIRESHPSTSGGTSSAFIARILFALVILLSSQSLHGLNSKTSCKYKKGRSISAGRQHTRTCTCLDSSEMWRFHPWSPTYTRVISKFAQIPNLVLCT